MIRFILGEDRHVKYFVRSMKNEYFAIKEASFQLLYGDKVEAFGACEVTKDENSYGCYVDSKIQPEHRSRQYTLEITLLIADEVIKNREAMEVV